MKHNKRPKLRPDEISSHLNNDQSINAAKAFIDSDVFDSFWSAAEKRFQAKNPIASPHPHMTAHSTSSRLAIVEFKQLFIDIILSEKEEDSNEDATFAE